MGNMAENDKKGNRIKRNGKKSRRSRIMQGKRRTKCVTELRSALRAVLALLPGRFLVLISVTG
jgi:hypothetical protein